MESCFIGVCKIACADYSFTLSHVGHLAVKLLMSPGYTIVAMMINYSLPWESVY